MLRYSGLKCNSGSHRCDSGAGKRSSFFRHAATRACSPTASVRSFLSSSSSSSTASSSLSSLASSSSAFAPLPFDFIHEPSQLHCHNRHHHAKHAYVQPSSHHHHHHQHHNKHHSSGHHRCGQRAEAGGVGGDKKKFTLSYAATTRVPPHASSAVGSTTSQTQSQAKALSVADQESGTSWHECFSFALKCIARFTAYYCIFYALYLVVEVLFDMIFQYLDGDEKPKQPAAPARVAPVATTRSTEAPVTGASVMDTAHAAGSTVAPTFVDGVVALSAPAVAIVVPTDDDDLVTNVIRVQYSARTGQLRSYSLSREDTTPPSALAPQGVFAASAADEDAVVVTMDVQEGINDSASDKGSQSDSESTSDGASDGASDGDCDDEKADIESKAESGVVEEASDDSVEDDEDKPVDADEKAAEATSEIKEDAAGTEANADKA